MIVPCSYCEQIARYVPEYPICEAVVVSDIYRNRCSKHWQYICDTCMKSYHFSGVAWDKEAQEFVCLNCASSVKLYRDKFWNYEYCFIMQTSSGEWLKALDRLEYENQHPVDFGFGIAKNLAPIPRHIRAMGNVNKRKDVEVPDEKLISDYWDQNAEAWNANYTDAGDPQRKHLVPFELILEHLGEAEFVLDAGCGAGFMSRFLARQEKKVVGVDNSHAQLRLAEELSSRERSNSEYPLYIKSSLTNLNVLNIFGLFDAAVCITVLENIEDYSKAICELGRSLRVHGKLILTTIHPCFSMKDMITVRNPVDGVRVEDIQHWKIDSYFSRGISLVNYSSLPAPTITFHRTLEDYCEALYKAGFLIARLLEPLPTLEQLDEDPQLLKSRSNRIPRFLTIIAEKRHETN